jgi:2-polyprenyl-3-methyl-5-hydroxy-6-metoxy-1,4-benzoquinol methylase/uncharacterized protein YbaR (Trm112 family)
MKRRVLDFLACPFCEGGFELRNISVVKPAPLTTASQLNMEEIVAGVLVCPQGHAFGIVGGVPRLRLDQKLDKAPTESNEDALSIAASFGAEWSHFDYERDNTWFSDVQERCKLFLKEVAMTAEELRGKNLLDAGCGNGSLSIGLSQFGCEVVAIDVSPSVEVAYKHYATKGNDQTHFVQGDLMNPPFKREVFDVIFSSGVLHHNPDTRGALRAIAKSLAPAGRIYIWVYRNIPGIGHKLKELVRRTISPMPSVVKHTIVALWLPQAMLRQYVRTAMGRNTARDRLKWSERFVMLLDHYTPRWRWEHTPDEVKNWYCELGYNQIELTEDREWGFGVAATKPPRASAT